MIIISFRQKHNTAEDTQVVKTFLAVRLILVLSVKWENHKKNVVGRERHHKILYVHKNTEKIKWS